MTAQRPHTTVVLAMSADGKIADRDRHAARFSSAADLAHLETQVARMDAVLFGAGTLRAYGTCLPVRQSQLIAQRRANQQPEQPIQIVCSRSGHLDATLRFFQQPVPRWLVTTPQGAHPWQETQQFNRILLMPSDPSPWKMFLKTLWDLGIQRLGILGGGTLVGELVAQDLIDEMYLTICPLLLGGQQSPTPVDGAGLTVAQAIPLELVNASTVANEVFLHYRRCHPKRD